MEQVGTSGGFQTSGGFLARVPAELSELRFVRTDIAPASIRLHPDGQITVRTSSTSMSSERITPEHEWWPRPEAILPEPCPDTALMVQLDPDGNYRRSTFVPSGLDIFASTEGTAIWGTGYLAPTVGFPYVRLDWNAAPGRRLLCAYSPGLSALNASGGAVVELRGSRIGAATLVERPVDLEARLAAEVDGFQVMLAGQSARVLVSSPGRIVAILPQVLKEGSREKLSVLHEGKEVGSVEVMTQAVRPGPVDGLPGLQVTNENGTANGEANPSSPGEILTLHVAGMGPLNPPAADGQLNHEVLAEPGRALTASMPPESCEVVSARQMQGFPSGILEVRVRLPQLLNVSPGDHRLTLVLGIEVGTLRSRSFGREIAVRVPLR